MNVQFANFNPLLISSPRLVLACLVALLVASASAAAQPDVNQRIDGGGDLTEADLAYVLQSLRPGEAQLQSIAQQGQSEHHQPLDDRFPKLTAVQRKFAVNPAFRSFYDSSYKREEGISKYYL